MRTSPIDGLGAFAAVDLRSGELVARYAGKRYSRVSKRPAWHGGATYLFLLSDGSFIDGAVNGNATRHINHACSPNVIAVEDDGDDGQIVVNIFALRAIVAGRELLLDYSLDLAGERPSDYQCNCSGKRCRGTMAATTS